MKKQSRLTVIILGLCAVVWSAAFALALKQCRSNKKDINCGDE